MPGIIIIVDLLLYTIYCLYEKINNILEYTSDIRKNIILLYTLKFR